MKGKLLIAFIVICILLSVIFIKYKDYNTDQTNSKDFSNPEQNDLNTFDAEIPKDTIFIDPSNSKDFIYKAVITINSVKDTNNTSLLYEVTITPKTSIIYKDVVATAFIDKDAWDILVVNSYFCFGTDKKNKETMDVNSKDNKGIVFGRQTWINKSIDYLSKEIQNKLKSDIKVKITSNKNVEYVNIPSKDIQLVIK